MWNNTSIWLRNFLEEIRVSFTNKDILWTRLRAGVLAVLLFGSLYELGRFVPEGFDWRVHFSQGRVPSIWTPWTEVIIRCLNWPLVFAITLFSIIIRVRKYSRSPLPIIFAIISLPTLWVLFLGNLDGLVLLGLILSPWGIPLILMKPQISAFALLSNRRSFIFGVVWFIISLGIWGLWPLNWLLVFEPGWQVEWSQDIGLFPWGLLIALPLLWFSRKDEDLLMAAGSFATPHLFPYHFVLLMPALARMKWPWLIATWLVSWTPLLANWLGDLAWHFGNLMSVFFWLGIYFSRPSKTVDSNKQVDTAKVEARSILLNE